jgi:uncharacterized membrane protein YwzB
MHVILVSICPRKPNGRTQFLSFDLEHRNAKKNKKKIATMALIKIVTWWIFVGIWFWLWLKMQKNEWTKKQKKEMAQDQILVLACSSYTM